STSWCGFAAAIVEWGAESGRAAPRVVPIPTGAYPAAAARPAYSVLDNGAIAKAFGIALADWESQLRLCMAE
ncbi:MAG: sugar nucleotide-binding protein, partial [Alphaproteobacteria bacterium]|nr:sugar nucleotide-binding protein [Alphaproteobacteria bacterium]